MNNMVEICEKLRSFKSDVRLNTGADNKDIEFFEQTNGITLPPEFREFLTLANGGEIFIPGTEIYGISTSSDDSIPIREHNRSEIRNHLFSIPKTHLIIAKLNFGDFICINLNFPYDVIQWDHEENALYCTWMSFSEWINDSIADFIALNGGDR